ncbi:ABC transporter permease, partial [Arthrobacter deserti]|nr:ABC transporter permease [Arthrobacter deserti]
RLSPLFAKALVIAAVAAVVGILSSFATYFLMQPVLAPYGFEFGLDVEDLVQSMLLSGAYLALAALMALALGSLLRNSAGGIVTLVALFLVLPTVLGFIQLDWVQDALPYLPPNAGRQLLALEVAEGELSQLQGGLVMAAWSAVLLAAAAVATKTRDV